MTKILGLLAGGTCAAAGIYLLSQQSVADPTGGGTSWFEILAHGIGIYFIGKGAFVAVMMWRAAEEKAEAAALVDALKRPAPVEPLRKLLPTGSTGATGATGGAIGDRAEGEM